MIDYTQEIAEAAAYVREKLDLGGQGVDIGIVLGSALGGFTDKLSEKKELSYSNIPHMPGTSVIGHSGNLYSGKVGGKHIICFSGRVHSYEGIPLHKVCFQVRLMAALQCKLYILTNASGGAGEGMMPGSLVALRDHINFARIDPMNEFYDEFIKNRYVSSKSIWSNRCCEVAHQVASEMGIKLFDGVYCWTSGPSFETPLEVATGVKSGAVCFGMSTVPEALTAKACGMEVFGLSLATNLAAGISEQDLSHDDVKETASLHGDSFQKFLENVLSKLDVIDTKVESSSEAPLIFESVPAWTRDTAQDFATSVGHQFDSKTFNKAIIATSGVDYSIDKLLSNPKTLQLSKLNGFPVVSKAGHNGKLVSGGYNGEQVVAIVSGHGEGFHATEASFLVEVLYFLGVTQSVLVLSSATTDPSKENGIKTSFVNGIIDLSRGLHVDTLQQHFEPASEYPDLVTKRTRNIAQQHNMPACNHAVFTDRKSVV